jgi:hypothetical protein
MLGNEIPVEFPHFVRVACHSICEKVSIKVVIKPQAFGIWMQQASFVYKLQKLFGNLRFIC